MKLSLRWRILFLTALAPLLLAAAALYTVHHDVAQHVDDSSLHENLDHSVAVFEGMLATRSRALAGGAKVVAQDPRFFSLLMLGVSQQDTRFTQTVKLMAHDFNAITQTDLFEVLDRRGRVLASTGEAKSTPAARDSFVQAALKGKLSQGVLIEDGAHYQVVAAPVRGDGRVVGVLLLGATIGSNLASELRSQMRCEVTFLNGSRVTGTTLADTADRRALAAELAAIGLGSTTVLQRLGILRVGSGTREFLTIIRHIPDTPRSEAQFYVLQRSFDPEVTFANTIRRDLLAIAAAALILAVLGGLLLGAQILIPIHRLVRGAREMQAGNYDHPLDVRRGDELGYLARQFSDMRQRERAYVGSLEQATRLKSEFIHIASHELRTPISVISGYLDVLAAPESGIVTDKHRRMVDAMRDHLGRLTRVAEHATQIAEVQSERITLDIQLTPLGRLVTTTLGMARASSTGREVRFESEVADSALMVPLDPQRMGEALLNLVTNGVRFTPDGGRVLIRAWVVDEALHIAVEDEGTGIAPDALATLRSHGLSAHEAQHHHSATGLEHGSHGLGLGLPLTRGIVEAHGGELHIESELGRGSVFTVVLPLAESARAAA